MSDCIFTKESLTKSQIYNKIKTLLTTAGWANISSKPATDYDVFYSKGESGDKDLCFQLNDTDNIGNSTNGRLHIRMIDTYVPGSAGTSGTFGRPSSAWYDIVVYDGSTPLGPDAVFNLYYHINKNRIILVIEPPIACDSTPQFVFIGMSNESANDAKRNDDLIFAASFYTAVGWNQNILSNCPVGIKQANPYLISTLILNNWNTLPFPREYTGKEQRPMYKIGYGNASEGFRGFVDGVYGLITQGLGTYPIFTRIRQNDILIGSDGTSKYKVFVARSNGQSVFGYFGPNDRYLTAWAIRVV